MARRVEKLLIEAAGRDQGKVFVITEASATVAEDWAARAFLIVAGAGVDLPDDIIQNGIAGIAAVAVSDVGMSFFKQLSWTTIKPLADEMLSCVTVIPDPKVPNFSRALHEDDIEEIKTIWEIRKAIVKLHSSFLNAGTPST